MTTYPILDPSRLTMEDVLAVVQSQSQQSQAIRQHFATHEPDGPLTASFCIDRISGAAGSHGPTHYSESVSGLAEAIESFLASC